MEINYDVPPTLMQKPSGQKHMDFEPREDKNQAFFHSAGGRAELHTFLLEP